MEEICGEKKVSADSEVVEQIAPRNEKEKTVLNTFLDHFCLFVTENHPHMELMRCVCKHCNEEFLAGSMFVLAVLDNHLFLKHTEDFIARRKERREIIHRRIKERKEKRKLEMERICCKK